MASQNARGVVGWREAVLEFSVWPVSVNPRHGSWEASSVNETLFRTVIASVPACLLVAGAVIFFFRVKTVLALLQLVGAGSLLVVVLVHVFEALHLLPWMNWGLQHSPGHYLDLASAILGLTLFPLGYLLQALTMPRDQRIVDMS